MLGPCQGGGRGFSEKGMVFFPKMPRVEKAVFDGQCFDQSFLATCTGEPELDGIEAAFACESDGADSEDLAKAGLQRARSHASMLTHFFQTECVMQVFADQLASVGDMVKFAGGGMR